MELYTFNSNYRLNFYYLVSHYGQDAVRQDRDRPKALGVSTNVLCNSSKYPLTHLIFGFESLTVLWTLRCLKIDRQATPFPRHVVLLSNLTAIGRASIRAGADGRGGVCADAERAGRARRAGGAEAGRARQVHGAPGRRRRARRRRARAAPDAGEAPRPLKSIARGFSREGIVILVISMQV